MIDLKLISEVTGNMILSFVEDIEQRQEEAGNTKDPYIRWKRQIREKKQGGTRKTRGGHWGLDI